MNYYKYELTRYSIYTLIVESFLPSKRKDTVLRESSKDMSSRLLVVKLNVTFPAEKRLSFNTCKRTTYFRSEHNDILKSSSRIRCQNKIKRIHITVGNL